MRVIGARAIWAACLATALLFASHPASAEDEWLTNSSLIQPESEQGSFERYDYVNPDAPKGGTLNSVALGTYDSFNPFIVRGTQAAGLNYFGGLLWDTLMQQSLKEPSTSYPLIAEAFKHPEDNSSATYRINPKARWHDGAPITAEDVVWSLNMLKKHSPQHTRYFSSVVEAVALSEREVEFRFDQKGNKELPHIMGDLPVLPKHWWEGTDADGKKRNFTQPTLEPPLGSGPYRIESFTPGSEIVWKRVEDYWAADLPVNVGRYNVDRRKYTYIQDENAAWLAFTKGGLQDIRVENRSRRWATEYTFPAVKDGDVIKKEFPTGGAEPMQGFVLNTRRPKFQDRRIREALTLAFNFEDMNRTLFFDSYTRTDSYFEGTELAATGLPEGRELEILEEFRDKLPPELFTEEFKLPVYDNPQAERTYLREAIKLFSEAGWSIKSGKMTNNGTGQQFSIEFLGNSPSDEITTSPYMAALRKIGIDVSLRIIDPSQYVNRIRNFDFDAVASIFVNSLSPGNEQREYWGSKAADTPGTRNLAGVKDPIVDALVEKIIYVKDREELVAASRALDRVLLWNYYWVPQWHAPYVRIAYWNKFGMPEKQPEYAGVDLESWWIDPEREKALAAKYRSQN
ncbi:extracellular solute-binding protein [Nitratireductor sp. L1-7-SE]|uniref:Extracellular solute-binding protein n=1 Tax=Nitratireductor rhodophyticola TaxID=2854036 RepID=A0ABS7R8K2_9HYPH|nr:extracellular solute-binding protein [Nitratireductor rhodophyticola]MBY8917261.1 extracellular solute-binding protein [Nitratireductor rhodophyticola]MBY8920310.1 extracellular solute-binding protein [Nitratireductor rhodophyticola]